MFQPKLLLVGSLMLLGAVCLQSSGGPKSGQYYYRLVFDPEGERQGLILKLIIHDDETLCDHLERITFSYPTETIYLDAPKRGGNYKASIKMANWELFEKFPHTIFVGPVEHGYIKGDSILIQNALFVYPQTPNQRTKKTYYSFSGKISDTQIHGSLTKEFLAITRGDTIFHSIQSWEATFTKQP